MLRNLFETFVRAIARHRDDREIRRLRRVILDQDDRVLTDLSALREKLQRSEERERQLREVSIPKLEGQLEVERAYSLGLATMVEKLRSQYEADVAANIYRVARGRFNESEATRDARLSRISTDRMN